MPQSFSDVLIHLIFSTKNRYRFITPAVESELYAYICGIARELGCPILKIGGDSDYVHILFKLSRTETIAHFVEMVKKRSSKWIKSKGDSFKAFRWQAGYGAFSMGQKNVEHLIQYIEGQKTHHKTITFQEEYRRFLKAYGLDYDERYVWD